MSDFSHISVILPAKNEEDTLRDVLNGVRRHAPGAQVIVVDDGSNDRTGALARELGATVISHPVAMGNGAAIKTGVRHATGDVVVCMDSDGQHDPAEIPRLVECLKGGYAMAVGARSGDGQATRGRWLANGFYNRFASWMTNHAIRDLTSGFRAAEAAKFREFLHLLPNGFSYPTTITMAFLRAGYPVMYLPIGVQKRNGKSHIRPIRDGLRFLLIIFRVGTLYSPLKLFVPVSATFFLLGLGYYLYTYVVHSRFTNMSALLFVTSVVVFLIGLVSEQITALTYSQRRE